MKACDRVQSAEVIDWVYSLQILPDLKGAALTLHGAVTTSSVGCSDKCGFRGGNFLGHPFHSGVGVSVQNLSFMPYFRRNRRADMMQPILQ